MIDLIKPEVPNFGRYCLERGGRVKELHIPVVDQEWPGLCNPSIYNDNGQLRVIIRNVNFVMHVSDNEDRNWSDWGPLLYANRPSDGRNMRTRNFLATLNDDLSVDEYFTIDTKRLDKKPIWEFVGLEDARLVRWEGELYGIGVRRDDNTEGKGRMEMSHINEHGEELGRAKINHKSFGYCEKNWIPVLDQPWTFVRFSYPTCIVKTNNKGIVQDIKEYPVPENITLNHDMQLRGSSQVLPWKDGGHIALLHTCNLWIEEQGKKVARYHYHFIIWDKDWNILKISRLFCFNDFRVEFGCGMCEKDGKYIFSAAIQDNYAYLMSVDKRVVEDFIFERESPIERVADDDMVTKFFFNDKNPEFLYNYGVDLRDRNKLTEAHIMFQHAADLESYPYNSWFMKTRCVADVGDRDELEYDGWWKLIVMDNQRPEGYLALSLYYWYRNDVNLSYYFAHLAYVYSDNGEIYYNKDQYIYQYLITMLFTERAHEAAKYIEELPDTWKNLKDEAANIISQRNIERIL